MFRCAACQRSFAIRFDAPAPAPAAPTAEAAPATPAEEASTPPEEQNGLLLRQEGRVYHVRDLAMMQRWVAERRVLIGDEMSRGDGCWTPVAGMEELKVFFDLVAAVDRAAEVTDVAGEEENTEWEQTELIPDALPPAEPAPPIELSTPTTTHVDEEEIALEGIPEEDVVYVTDEGILGPDDPTMDLGEDAGAFFTGEEPLDPNADLFTAVTEEYCLDDDPDFEWAGHQRRRTAFLWFVLFVVGGGIGYGVLQWLEAQDAVQDKKVQVVPEPKVEQVAPAPVKPEPIEPVEPVTPLEDNTPQPPAAEPPPDPPAAPSEPAEPPRVTASGAIRSGWSAVDRQRWSAARGHFQAALGVDAGSSEARLGLAYVAEHQGNVDAAVTMYCRLKSSASGSTRTEAEGRLRDLRRTCP